MAFNYGKNTLNIKNPFKVEGKLDLIFGTLSLILGILELFQIRNSTESDLKNTGWIEFLLSLIFIIIGVTFLVKGSMRLFKFLVGREIPSDISPKPYHETVIEKVLMKRANPTFVEKNNFVSRLLISVNDKILFLPIGFRNLLESISSLFISFIIFLIVYLLIVFSTSVGLISLTDKKSIISLFGLIFLAKQLIVWIYYLPSKNLTSGRKPKAYNYKNIALNIFLAVFIPILIEFYVKRGGIIPQLNFNVVVPIILLFILSVILISITYFLCIQRLDVLNPETAVSEYKEHIQISVHPKDIFRCFDFEMANKRYKELPNRIYKEIKPILELEGSLNKGSFKGSTIQETQPEYIAENLPELSKTIRFYAALAGRLLMILSFIYLFFSINFLNHEFSFSTVFNVFYYPILISLFSYYLMKVAHIFYSEMLFTSHLVHFFTEGTYTESKISSGMSVYDSNRSENTIVNTSATPWILVSKIVTSTLSDSSTRNLEGDRYILEMYKDEEFLRDLVKGFTNYLNDRKLIVAFNSKTDINNSLDFHKLNEMTRVGNSEKNTNNIEHISRRGESND